MTKETVNNIYNVLVNIGGANEKLRGEFVHYYLHEGGNEWRFSGKLGFGGKYRIKTNRVDCYQEDETPERLRLISLLNSALKEAVSELKIYRIPLSERVCSIEPLAFKQKLVEVDGIGIYVNYRHNWQLRKKWIRRHLIGLHSNYTYVKAASLKEAIEYFNREYEGAKVGRKAKALSIRNEREEIDELPNCEHILEFDTMRMKCGVYEVEEGEQPTASCVLDGCDCPPHDCPIARTKQAREFSEVVIEDGFRVRKFRAMAIQLEEF